VSVEAPSKAFLSLLILCSITLGYFSWRYVEQPFRNVERVSKKRFFTFLLIIFVLLSIAAGVGIYKRGIPERYSADQQDILKYLQYHYPKALRRGVCLLEPEQSWENFRDVCYGGHTNDSFLVWGDSLAATSVNGILSQHSDVIQLTSSACPPLIQSKANLRPNCSVINNFVLNEIKRRKPAKFFLQANWAAYGDDVPSALSATIAAVASVASTTEIILIGSTPQWPQFLPRMALKRDLTLTKEARVILPNYKTLNDIDESLQALADEHKVRFISILSRMCESEACLAVVEDSGKYWLTTADDVHFTEGASNALYKNLATLLSSPYEPVDPLAR
jgi:hypothetical protein